MSVFRSLLAQIASEQKPEYTLLNYIESNGNQYIDSGIIGNSNSDVEIDMAFTNVNTQNIVGSRYNWGTNRFALTLIGTSGETKNLYFYKRSSNYPYKIYLATYLKERHTYKINMDGLYIDGVKQILNDDYDTSTTAYTTNNSMYIFWTHDTSYTYNYDQKATIKLYGCKIYQNGELVRDFIPVLDTNEVPCLFDKISSAYFYNQGTGTFTYELL